jgi:hypothetical protein
MRSGTGSERIDAAKDRTATRRLSAHSGRDLAEEIFRRVYLALALVLWLLALVSALIVLIHPPRPDPNPLEIAAALPIIPMFGVAMWVGGATQKDTSSFDVLGGAGGMLHRFRAHIGRPALCVLACAFALGCALSVWGLCSLGDVQRVGDHYYRSNSKSNEVDRTPISKSEYELNAASGGRLFAGHPLIFATFCVVAGCAGRGEREQDATAPEKAAPSPAGPG